MTTSSGSLEECYTNTELSGLKWRRLTTKEGIGTSPDLNQDLIIKSYLYCVENNVYCTWRRSSPTDVNNRPAENIPLRTDHKKEFFIFWFTAEEPPVLKKLLEDGLIAPDDIENVDQVIKYEARIHFFKALHQVFERNLLRNGCIRLGHWFARPFSSAPRNQSFPSHVSAFKCHFQVLGENHVCVILDVQRQQPILRISKRILDLNRPLGVILGPWSMQATLLPNQPFYGYNGRKHDLSKVEDLQTLLNDQYEVWTRLFPSPDGEMEDKATADLPKFLLVDVGGERLFCPWYLICMQVTELEAAESSATAPLSQAAEPSDDETCLHSTSLLERLSRRRRKQISKQKAESYIPPLMRHSRRSYLGVRIGSKNFEDACLAPSQRTHRAHGGQMILQTTEDVRFNFVDYLPKSYCCCKSCDNPPVPIIRPTVFHRGAQPFSSLSCAPGPTFKESAEDGHLLAGLGDLGAKEHLPDSGRETPGFARGASHASRKVGERLDLDNPLKDLSQHAENFATSSFTSSQVDADYPVVVQAFNPVTNISSPMVSDVEYVYFHTDYINFLSYDKIRNYSFHYNPLKRDVAQHEPYHQHVQKPVGPLQSCSTATGNAPSSSTTEQKPATSILSQLLNEADEPSTDEWVLQYGRHIRQRQRWRFFEYGTTENEHRCKELLSSVPHVGHRTHSLPDLAIDDFNAPGTSRKRHAPNRRKTSRRTFSLSPVRNYDPLHVSVHCNEEDALSFLKRGMMESLIRSENELALADNEIEAASTSDGMFRASPVVTAFLDGDAPCEEMKKMLFEEPMDYEDPKTPGSVPCTDEFQVFSSMVPPASDILSPPASNERVETIGGQVAISAPPQPQPTAGPQSLVSVPGATEGLLLHSTCWNTSAVVLNNAGDSLSIIYPTPPTPMQQFSPINMNVVEDPAAKVMRPAADEGASTSAAMEISNEYRFSNQVVAQKRVDNLVFDPVAKKLPLPLIHYNDLFCIGVDVKRRIRLDKTSADPSDLRKTIKKALQKRSQRSIVRIVPQYMTILKQRHVAKALPDDIVYILHNNAAKMIEHSLNFKNKQSRFKSFGTGIVKILSNYRRNAQRNVESVHRLQQQAVQGRIQHNQMPYPQQVGMQPHPPQAGTPGPMAGAVRPQYPPVPYNYQQAPQHPNAVMRGYGAMTPQQFHQIQQQRPMNEAQILQIKQRRAMFNTPSPASSMSSNPQSVPPMGMDVAQGRPGSVAPSTSGNMLSAPSPFGSPSNMGAIGSVGGSFPAHRTPGSMPASVLNYQDPLRSNNPEQSLSVQPRVDPKLFEELLGNLRTNKLWNNVVAFEDTFLNLFHDPIFDACPICSCNGNIRSRELGLYIQMSPEVRRVDQISAQQLEDPNYRPDYWSGLIKSQGSCACGFSAIRHRLLSEGQNFFPDDLREACVSLAPSRHASTRTILMLNKKAMEMADVHRYLSANYMMYRFSSACLGDVPESLERHERDFSSNSTDPDYVVSKIETEEFDIAASSLFSPAAMRRPWFHPWGLQVARNVPIPRDNEYMALIREVQPILESSIKQIRGSEFTGRGNIVEGPLTWRQFHKKAVKSSQDDESFKPELIPNVLITADKDPIATNPQLVHMWEKLTMAPYDQPKDVTYVALVPEGNLLADKCKVFMEELSTVYERCRFGRHVKVLMKGAPGLDMIRDGVFSIPSNCTVNKAQGYGEENIIVRKMQSYSENVENALKNFFQNEYLFDKRHYVETLYKDSLQTRFTSLVSNSDSSNMPPPAPPQNPSGIIQSPSSVLSTQSGPASHGQPVATPPNLNLHQQSPQVVMGLNPQSNEGMAEPIRTPENPVGTPNSQYDHQQSQSAENSMEKAVDEIMSEEVPHAFPHVVVIYIVSPMTFGTEAFIPRASVPCTLVLGKMIHHVMRAISPRFRPQIQLELINAQTILDYSAFSSSTLREERQDIEPIDVVNSEKMSAQDCLRRIAFSVYSQTRLVVPENVRGVLVKSMTRFGPAAAMSDILDMLKPTQDNDFPTYFKVPTQPFILAPRNVIGMTNSSNKFMLLNSEERVLFVSYCLVEDGHSLCASVTDQYGHLSDNVIINMGLGPEPGKRYRNKSQTYDAIFRLWLYIQSVLVMDTRNWRLIISRVGKIGHGEFRAWSQILSKKSLRAFNSNLRGKGDKDLAALSGPTTNCRACAVTPNLQEVPVIMSACLVSMEAEPNLRVFPTVYPNQESSKSRGSSKNVLPTIVNLLDDTSITHIITFPTSPEISTDQSNQQNQDTDDGFDMSLFGEGGIGEDAEFGDLLDNTDFEEDATRQETITIDHQPMATGYLVSTAPANGLPDWFWSQCPNAKRHLPVHLRTSLHINSSNLHEDIGLGNNQPKNGSETFHPLDEVPTDAILRYVMQMHNALSWLNVDLTTGARQSCLPVHMQTLVRLYVNFRKSVPVQTRQDEQRAAN